MSVSQDQVVDYIKNLKLGEVKGLIERLEGELGVKASAPMMMGAAAAGPAAAAAAEKTEFDVIIKSAGENKINVIKVIREVTGLGLKEAKTLSETADGKVKEGIGKDEANKIAEALKGAGATVELK
jgi:large subunit ribosomal protein L7/L12